MYLSVCSSSLVRDFLETLYSDISQYQLRTEKNDVSGTLTSEMWMDLQLQTHVSPEQGFMITTSFMPDMLQSLKTCAGKKFLKRLRDPVTVSVGDDVEGAERRRLASGESGKRPRRPSLISAYENTYRLLNTDEVRSPLDTSMCIYGSPWVVDSGLVDCLWMPMISVGPAASS